VASSRAGRTLNRDYKDVRRHAPAAPGPAFNGWTGFGAGLGVGLAIALAVHLVHLKQAQVVAEPVPVAAKAPASATAADDGAIAPAYTPTGPALDFYDMLPRQEVEIASEPAKGATEAARAPLPSGDVILQAGSFKQSPEAEKMQAQLALMGISARIQRASVDDETWYRVRIGPIATVEELRNVQSKLREAEISATAVTPAE
jgi:cell division protein FtsN